MIILECLFSLVSILIWFITFAKLAFSVWFVSQESFLQCKHQEKASIMETINGYQQKVPSFEHTKRNCFKFLPDATSCRNPKNRLISALRVTAMLTNSSSGKTRRGISDEDLSGRTVYGHKVASSTSFAITFQNLNSWKHSLRLPVQQPWSIGPNKLNKHCNDKHKACESQKIVAKPFEEDPDSRCTCQDTRRDLLIPP